MTPDLPSLLFALLSFVVTFTVARGLGKWLKRRQTRRAEAEAGKNQSRQVRRARQRRQTPRG